MKEKSVKCERAMLVALLAISITLLLGGIATVSAVTHTEVASVTRGIVPDVVEPDAKFEVTLSITYEELPLVVGIVEAMPEGYSFVSCPTKIPAAQCQVSGDKVAFTVICKEDEAGISEITYKVKAPSTGRGTFEGEFVDLLVLTSTLPEEEGKEGRWHPIDGETMSRVRAVGEGASLIEEGVTATPTPIPTTPPTPPPASKVPGFEAIFAAVALLIVYTVVLRKKGKKGR